MKNYRFRLRGLGFRDFRYLVQTILFVENYNHTSYRKVLRLEIILSVDRKLTYETNE